MCTPMAKLALRILALTAANEAASLVVADDLILASMLTSTALVAAAAIAVSIHTAGRRLVSNVTG